MRPSSEPQTFLGERRWTFAVDAGPKGLPPLPVCSGKFPEIPPRRVGLSALHTLMVEAAASTLRGFLRSPAGKLAAEVSGTQERTLTR